MGHENKTEICIEDYKAELRSLINDKYGSIGLFLKSDDAKNLGLLYRDRIFFYECGGNSLDKLNRVSKFFGKKEVKKEIKIVKTVVYYVED